MKGNKKGTLVFIRTPATETRNTILSLYEDVTKEIKGTNGVSTLIAHVYSKVIKDDEKGDASKTIKADKVASTIIDGILKGHPFVFIPKFMIVFNSLLIFLPVSVVQMLEGFFFGDRK